MRCMFLITNKATFYLQLGLFTPLSNIERKLCIMTIKYNICEKRHEKKDDSETISYESRY